ncbi:putative ABC transport system permease protein [Paracoccus chinensis]|uniref:Putative ABC transport system permease protein n=2 Tax=Paracoccus chinensis TaxID=525640 RepID=A0A1G9L5H1_9RHOB|nr:putative ABC transport system permease protein [Paracoccus chinensis]
MTGRARLVLAALMSHWRRRPLQLAMLLAGIMLATALWSGVQAVNAEARASYAEAADRLGTGTLDRLEPAPGAVLTTADFVALRRAGWIVSPLVEGRLRAGEGRVALLGIEPATRVALGPAEGGAVAEGDLLAFITPPGLGFADAEVIRELEGADLGGLTVAPREGLPPDTLVVDVGIAQRLLNLGERLTALVVAPEQPPGLAPLEQVAPHLLRKAPQDRADPEALTGSFHLNLTAFALLSFIVGLFITQSAVGLAFEQRRQVVRTLRALGVPLAEVLGVMAAELAILALVAGLAGILLGWAVAAALMPGVAATLSGLYGAEVSGALALRPVWVLSGLGMALAGAGLAGARGLLRTARMPLLAAGQARPWAVAAARGLRRQVLGAGALALALPLCLAWGGLVGGFAALACGLLAAALLLPVVLDAGLRWLAGRVRGVLAQWFVADTRQQSGGLSLALMALMLALAANIGVGTMVGSFRSTFLGWLDQRLVAELYVNARTEPEARAIRDWLAPQVDAILPIWSAEVPLRGQPGRVFGVVDHPTYRDHWPILRARPGAWNEVARGTGVLVNEQLFRRAGLSLGDSLDLPGGALPVVGVYSDYGNPSPQAIIGQDLFDARFPEAPRLNQAVRVDPDRAAALAEALRDRFDLPGSAVTDQAQVKAVSLRIFERTFSVTAALNVLTLGVAGIALLTGLLTLASMRLPQLAPVWAAGLTRRRLARLELARTLALAAATALYAVPVGLGLAWMLLAVINVEAFGWRLPMQISPELIARLGVAALATALAAGALPALRLARITPSQLLRVFADER